MDDCIKIKGGNGSSELRERELAYQKAEKALYIGTSSGNVKLCCANDMDSIIEKIDEKLTATPAVFQANLNGDAGIGEVVNALNSLISALKESGIMNVQEG